MKENGPLVPGILQCPFLGTLAKGAGFTYPRGTVQNRPMRDTSKPANGTRQDRDSYSRFELSKQGKSSPHWTELNYTVKT